MEFKRVVVTGLGTVNPLGNSIEEFWEGLKNGKSGAGPITRVIWGDVWVPASGTWTP